MADIREIYPLSTADGKAIPLDVARPLGSFFAVHNTPVVGSTETGQLLLCYALELMRVYVGPDPAPDMTAILLPYSFYLPAGAAMVVEAQGNVVCGYGISTPSVSLLVSHISSWRSLASATRLDNA